MPRKPRQCLLYKKQDSHLPRLLPRQQPKYPVFASVNHAAYCSSQEGVGVLQKYLAIKNCTRLRKTIEWARWENVMHRYGAPDWFNALSPKAKEVALKGLQRKPDQLNSSN